MSVGNLYGSTVWGSFPKHMRTGSGLACLSLLKLS